MNDHRNVIPRDGGRLEQVAWRKGERQGVTHVPSRAHDPARSRDSIPGLIKQLADDVSTLFRKEFSLARAEMREAAGEFKSGAASLATGLGLVISGILFVVLAAVFGLALYIPLWAAALVVGIAVLVIGMVTVKAQQKKLRPEAFVPERTVESLHKDRNAARRVSS